jgi:hypothetical protein
MKDCFVISDVEKMPMLDGKAEGLAEDLLIL